MAEQVPKAHRLGRGEHRRDLDLLSLAPPAPQTLEVNEHARAPKRGDQATNPCRPDLSQCGELLTSGPGSCRRDARELAGAAPLPEHGGSARAQEGAAQAGRLTALWTTLRVPHRAHRISSHDQIADLYAHN